MSVLEAAAEPAVGQPPAAEAAAVAAAAAGQAAAPSGASKWVIDENEQLASNWEHRAWTYGCISMLAGTFLQGCSQIGTKVLVYNSAAHGFHGTVRYSTAASTAGTFLQGCSQVSDPGDALLAAASFLAAYTMSDLATGIYHWSVDNYGGPDTPLVGRQIAAFQGHHQRPWTITMRQFCNNVHQVFKPATAPAATFLLASHFLPMAWNVWVSWFVFLVCMSQQSHAWSHMKKSELPDVVVALQDAGVLISRKAHGAHHRSPFDCNYCIVSGIWNPLLDGSGFFPALERMLHTTTGVEPRSWSPPLADWQELERPQGL